MWTYRAPCSTCGSIISILQSQAMSMEEELKKWNETVFEARNNFYELNYFTTIQLLLLRQELGALSAASDTTHVPSSILALLQSVSPEITSQEVCKAVKGAADHSLMVGGAVFEQSTGYEADIPIFVDSKDKVESDKPILQEDQLSDEQRGIMAYVVQRLNCSKLLVLKSFEVNEGKDMNKYEYKKWCNNNLDVYEYKDEDNESEDDSVSHLSIADSSGVPTQFYGFPTQFSGNALLTLNIRCMFDILGVCIASGLLMFDM